MKNTIYSLSVLALLCSAGVVKANAQAITPTVVVTNDYDVRTADASKAELEMSVPDSVKHFNTTFEYSVFSNPYKGAYKFTPYGVRFSPSASEYDGSSFYLNAGAGYTLHPELEAVWAPFSKGKFKMSVFAGGEGFYGAYRYLNDHDVADASNLLHTEYVSPGVLRTGIGYDLSGRFGLEGACPIGSTVLNFVLDYNGIYTSDARDVTNAAFHSVGGKVSVKTRPAFEDYFSFDANVLYRLSADKGVLAPVYENQFVVYGHFAPSARELYGLKLDYKIGYVGGRGQFSYDDYAIEAAPKVLFHLWKFDIATGFKVSYVDVPRFYPDLKAELKLFKNYLGIYAVLDGGDKLNSYSTFKQEYHHFNSEYLVLDQSNLAKRFSGYSREMLNARVGVRGAIGSFFQYDARYGVAMMKDAPVDCVRTLPGTGTNFNYLPGISFEEYKYTFGDFTATMAFSFLELDGGFHYRKTNLQELIVFYNNSLIDFAEFSADLTATANIRNRVFFGASVETQSPRTMMVAGNTFWSERWYDLGVHAEYRVNKNFSWWVKGSNLMNQSIQRNPFYAEEGIAVVGGIKLILR